MAVNQYLDEYARRQHLAFHVVTRQVAAAIHRELRWQDDKELRRLLQGRLTSQFVYDFFSCMAGRYLDGASTLAGEVPPQREYRSGGQFYWSGLYIAVVRDSRVPPFKPGSIRGICVFHDAYLSSYPGPNAFFHSVDPRITRFPVNDSSRGTRLRLAPKCLKRKKPPHGNGRQRSHTPTRSRSVKGAKSFANRADEGERTRLSGDLRDEFYDQPGIRDAVSAHRTGTGSSGWCDVPVLAGPGVGRLLLAHCMQLRCGFRIASEGAGAKKLRKRLSSDIALNFMVSVAGGHTNSRMLSLLDSFRFTRLYMSHPRSGEAWKDEAGAELYVASRKGPLNLDVISQVLTK